MLCSTILKKKNNDINNELISAVLNCLGMTHDDDK